MNKVRVETDNQSYIGVGSYTVAEAARLLHVRPISISRWMGGYQYKRNGDVHLVAALWEPHFHFQGRSGIELGFRDLIELRFIKAFTEAGLGLKTIRHCLNYARECVNDHHPFSTQRFQTDGKTIFFALIEHGGREDLLNLKKKQYEFRQIIDRTFKDLDLEDGTVARWRPYKNKSSIVIDPHRAFGQPISSEFGVPTVTLAQAVEAEGSIARAAEIYEVPTQVVRDALFFEESLRAA